MGRWVVVLMLVGLVAQAAPRSSDEIDRDIVARESDPVAVAALGEGKPRDEAIAKLVQRKRLDARGRALVPTRPVLKAKLASLLAREKDAQQLLGAETCGIVASTANELTIRCAKRGCGGGACQVVKGTVTVHVRPTGWTIDGLGFRRVGDTGECGCCM